MRIFRNGAGIDYKTGEVRIYMIKPKDMNCKLTTPIRVLGYQFIPDEFVNAKGVRMLSFRSEIKTADIVGFTMIAKKQIKSHVDKLRGI